MAVSKNLKFNITADPSGFEKEAGKVKSDLRSLGKVGDQALSELGALFGVNVGKIQEMSGAIRGLSIKLSGIGSGGSAALGKIVTAAGEAAAAVAAIGVTAATAGFKALNTEAERFRQTVEGANVALATSAYVDTYKQAFSDAADGLGKSMSGIKDRFQRWWGTLGTNLKIGAFSAFTGTDAGAMREDATAKAEQAAQITSEIYALQRKISDESVRQAELDAQIAEAKRRGYDSTLSAKEQADALAQATELIRQKYQGPAGIITLESQLADKMAELNNVVSSTPAQIDAANQQRVKANQAVAQYNNTLRELSERSKTVTTNLTKQREELERMAALRQSIASLELSTPGIPMPQGAKALTEDGIKVPVKAEVDQESFLNVTSQVASLAEGLSSAIGGLLGDLITGGDAWGNFRDAALSAFADMAVSIGKLAVAAGTAALGISQALKTPSKGVIAIAAGAALIALGAAVKAGLSNISAGNYSSTSSVASGSYSASGTSDYTKQEIQIKVSGTLKGSGRDLLAAIESAQEAKLVTT